MKEETKDLRANAQYPKKNEEILKSPQPPTRSIFHIYSLKDSMCHDVRNSK